MDIFRNVDYVVEYGNSTDLKMSLFENVMDFSNGNVYVSTNYIDNFSKPYGYMVTDSFSDNFVDINCHAVST